MTTQSKCVVYWAKTKPGHVRKNATSRISPFGEIPYLLHCKYRDLEPFSIGKKVFSDKNLILVFGVIDPRKKSAAKVRPKYVKCWGV